MNNNQPVKRRKKRIRSKIIGTSKRPRLSVFRSNKYMYAQIIDDERQKTIVGVSEKELAQKEKVTKVTRAQALGEQLAKKVKKYKITRVVFDRGSYKYHGRVKAVALGAQKGGLQF
ncbi:MAG: 50S ribosomal protein L18 [Candidatus Levybacteria bacterium]|nr:50S ribosomal protein L18 [Candidatus Levybacteria bacterium]